MLSAKGAVASCTPIGTPSASPVETATSAVFDDASDFARSLSGVKRTWVGALQMSAFDPKRTSGLTSNFRSRRVPFLSRLVSEQAVPPSRFAQSRARFVKKSRNETWRALLQRPQPVVFIPRGMNLKGCHRLFQIPRQIARAFGLHMRLL